jgi:hypothetical protein
MTQVNVYSIYTECSLNVHWMFPQCALDFPWMCEIYSARHSHAEGMPSTWPKCASKRKV